MRKTFASRVSHKKFLHRVYTELLELNKKTTQFKNVQKIWSKVKVKDISSEKIYQ